MTKKTSVNPKGTTLIDLDVCIVSVDGEPIWRQKQSVLGATLRDEDGNEIIEIEKLTRRKAILLGLALDPEADARNAETKLRAGYLQKVFWKDKEIKLDSDDVVFIKDRLNNKFNGTIYFIMCEYLEGVQSVPAPVSGPGPVGEVTEDNRSE